MSLSYEFKFMYEREDAKRTAPPISSFSVIGGASRTIHVDSPNSLSIGSEFEQARKFKNIVLFMPGSPGASDMRVAIDLTRFAAEKVRVSFSFLIRQFFNKKMIYLLQISDNEATVKKPPMMVYGDLLMVEFNLPSARLTHWEGDDYTTSTEL